MSGNKYDNLEKFFRSRLKSEGQSEQSWNAPPRGVLESAFGQLDQDKRRRRKLFFWVFGVGTVVAVIAIVGAITFNKLDDLDKKVDELSALNVTQAAEKSDDDQTVSADVVAGHNATNAAGGKSKVDQVPGEQKNVNTTESIRTNARKASTQSPGDVDHATREQRGSLNTKVHETENTTLKGAIQKTVAVQQIADHSDVKNSREVAMIEAKTSVIQSALVMLTPVAVSPFDLDDRLLNITSAVDPSMHTNPDRHITLYALAGHALSSYRMVNVGSPEFSLTGYNRSYSGASAGLGLNYPLSKRLRLDIHGTLSALQNRSTYQNEVLYHKANETTDVNGQIMYREQMVMESPIGPFVSEAEFALDGRDIAEESVMENKTQITQDFTIAGLYVGLDYLVLQRGRMSLYVGGGAGFNYFFGLDQCMNTKLSLDGSMLMNTSYEMKAGSDTNNIYVSVSGRAGVEYALGRQFFIRLQGDYDRALGTVRRSTSGSDVKTYLNSFKSGLVLGYTF